MVIDDNVEKKLTIFDSLHIDFYKKKKEKKVTNMSWIQHWRQQHS